MRRKAIEVTVCPTGELQIEAVGFKGADCERATAFLEQALGHTMQKSKKPAYYSRALIARQQRIGQ